MAGLQVDEFHQERLRTWIPEGWPDARQQMNLHLAAITLITCFTIWDSGGLRYGACLAIAGERQEIRQDGSFRETGD